MQSSRRLSISLRLVATWCVLVCAGHATAAEVNPLRSTIELQQPIAKVKPTATTSEGRFTVPPAPVRPAAFLESEPALLEEQSVLVEPPAPIAEEEIIESYEEPSYSMPMRPGQMHRRPEYCGPTPFETMWIHRFCKPWFAHRDPNDPERHFGIGEPLQGTSWRNRPWYVSFFAGGLLGDDLQEGQIQQGGGFFVGGRFGGDFDHFWGLESRLAFSDLSLSYTGLTGNGQTRNSYFDASLLYYPLGDTKWRPYLTVGFGLGNFAFDAADGRDVRGTAIGIPFGGGLKYHLGGAWALRFDVIDNFTWASGNNIDAMHNISFTGGLEIHFGGGRRMSYDPWR